MYHIKNDKRMLTSARMISEALDHCLETKAFKDITITDILNESTVSRATFYRLFDETTDILAYQCDKAFESILDHIKSIDTSQLTSEEITIIFAKFWTNNSSLAEKIIDSRHIGILYDSNIKYINDVLKVVYKGPSFSSTQCYYIASVLSAIQIAWIKEGKQLNPEDLVHNLDQVVIDLAAFLEK